MESTTVETFLRGLSYRSYLAVAWEFKQVVPVLPLEVWQMISLQLDEFHQWWKLAKGVPDLWRSWHQSASFRNAVYHRYAVVFFNPGEAEYWLSLGRQLLAKEDAFIGEYDPGIKLFSSKGGARDFVAKRREGVVIMRFQNGDDIFLYQWKDGHMKFKMDWHGKWEDVADTGLLREERDHLQKLGMLHQWPMQLNFSLFFPG